MNARDNMNVVFEYFDKLNPNPKSELNYTTPYELLVAVILSAQCTDKRVNLVTEKLFKVASTPNQMIELGKDKLIEIIKSCGYYNQKSKSIIESSYDIVSKFNGKIPNNMKNLSTLRGVGRKTANVVLANAFGAQTIAVDTHVLRVSKRLGLCNVNSTPDKCEQELLKIVPYERRSKFHHQMVLFGRYKCKAVKPNCDDCILKNMCKYYKSE
ncbi:MAG: endonuclease III [Clostridia bacterium]|nr:endonuclease III [Clostridia bacterium]